MALQMWLEYGWVIRMGKRWLNAKRTIMTYLLYKGEVWSGDPLETHADLLYTEEVDPETHDVLSYTGEVWPGDPTETDDELF